MKITNDTYRFKAKDGMVIDGYFTENSENNRNKLIIILPGLTGMAQQYIFIALRDILILKGYDVFIANLYSSEEINGKSPRCLLEINTERHICDFDEMIDHFSEKYKKVFAIGHSLSGRTLLFSNNSKLSAQILLDPAGMKEENKMKAELESFQKNLKDSNYKYIDWGDGMFHIVGGTATEMVYTPVKVLENATKNIKVPTLFIKAGNETIANGYEEIIPNIAKHITIKNACHVFVEYGKAKEVADNITDYLKDF